MIPGHRRPPVIQKRVSINVRINRDRIAEDYGLDNLRVEDIKQWLADDISTLISKLDYADHLSVSKITVLDVKKKNTSPRSG